MLCRYMFQNLYYSFKKISPYNIFVGFTLKMYFHAKYCIEIHHLFSVTFLNILSECQPFKRKFKISRF